MSTIGHYPYQCYSEARTVTTKCLKHITLDSLRLNHSEKKKESETNSITKQSIITEYKSTYKFPLNNNMNPKTLQFLGKKRILTSEERLLEKIKMEKELIEKEKKENWNCYEKSKQYKPMHLQPTPLTLLKPFKLSSNNSTSYLKKRQSSTKYETDLLNERIKQKIKEKCEKYNSEIQKDEENKKLHELKKIDGLYNTPVLINKVENKEIIEIKENKENINTQNLIEKENKNISIYDIAVKKIMDEINNNSSNMTLNEKITKYCEINQILLIKQNLSENIKESI